MNRNFDFVNFLTDNKPVVIQQYKGISSVIEIHAIHKETQQEIDILVIPESLSIKIKETKLLEKLDEIDQ